MKTVKMYSISDLKRSTVQIKLKMTNESKGPRTKMLLVYVGATDSSNYSKTTVFTLVVLFCVAYTLLTRPNQVETAVQSLHFWLSVWTLSCRCPVKAFHFYVVSALQFIVFVFYFWLIRAVSSSYVHQQHFRPRSLAFICHKANTHGMVHGMHFLPLAYSRVVMTTS